MYSRENNEAIPEVFPLGNATEIIELDPEDIILPVADDPVDFIIELCNECEDLQYIAEKTNELFNTRNYKCQSGMPQCRADPLKLSVH